MLYILLIILIVRPITVLLHELGHGLAALWVAKGKVTLYFGTYGEPEKGFNVRIGRLHCYFSSGIYLQGAGLCVLEPQPLSVARQMFYVVMGPMATLLALPFFLFYATDPATGEFAARLSFFCALSCGLDLLVNLFPREEPIRLKDGTTTYNDGRALLNLLSIRKHQPTYDQACAHYNAGEYGAAAPLFHHIVKRRKRAPELYRLTIAAYLMANEHQAARAVLDTMAHYVLLNEDDLLTRANLKLNSGDLAGAVVDLDHALRSRPDDPIALNNRGYAHELMGNYENALSDLDAAITLDPDHAFAHNNRGLVRIRQGDWSAALADLDRGGELDPNNAYVPRNRGILHYERGEYHEALRYLQQAETMETGIPYTEDYLKRTLEKMNA